MVSYDEEFGHFNAMCCKESYFIGENELNILESFPEERLLHNARVHLNVNQELAKSTDSVEIKEECLRSIFAVEFLIKSIKSDCFSQEIVPITLSLGKGRYEYNFQDQNRTDIHTSTRFACKLDKVRVDRRICTAAKKDVIETFSLNLIKWYGKKQYGPFPVLKRQRALQRKVSLDSTLPEYFVRIDFDEVATLDDAKQQVEKYIRNSNHLILPSALRSIVKYLYRKKEEDCAYQQLEDFLRPFADAPKQRFYHGSAFMNTWEELQGHCSLDEALNQSRMRKIAIVLAAHEKRAPLSPAQCMAEQVRIEQCLEKHNGYEIIQVGDRSINEPQRLLKEHFDQALEIIHEAISNPGDEGPVIGLMVWIKGHGEEKRKFGMVDDGDNQYTNISLVEQWIQTDDGLRVNVTEFGQALAEFAKENRHTKNPHFPIIITKDLCRINQDGGGRNCIAEPSLDVVEIDSASSGEKASDQHFTEQWRAKYVDDFKKEDLTFVAQEVANIVSQLNDQTPRIKPNLDPKYKCINGIYTDFQSGKPAAIHLV